MNINIVLLVSVARKQLGQAVYVVVILAVIVAGHSHDVFARHNRVETVFTKKPNKRSNARLYVSLIPRLRVKRSKCLLNMYLQVPSLLNSLPYIKGNVGDLAERMIDAVFQCFVHSITPSYGVLRYAISLNLCVLDRPHGFVWVSVLAEPIVLVEVLYSLALKDNVAVQQVVVLAAFAS
jgi:hypothetical protein